MPPEAATRQEFEGYIRRHESDKYAHAPMQAELTAEVLKLVEENGRRLNRLELWQARVVGGLAVLTVLVASGVITAVIELLRR